MQQAIIKLSFAKLRIIYDLSTKNVNILKVTPENFYAGECRGL